jgi:hypothetical protein
VSAGQLQDAFRQRAIGDTWQTIDDVQWRYDQKAGASILTISGTGKINWDDDGGGAKSLALPGGGFSPPERRVRAADQSPGVPFYTKPEYSCYVTTVRLPTSTQAKQWSSKASFDTRIFGRNYYRAWELRDGSIWVESGHWFLAAKADSWNTAECQTGTDSQCLGYSGVMGNGVMLGCGAPKAASQLKANTRRQSPGWRHFQLGLPIRLARPSDAPGRHPRVWTCR